MIATVPSARSSSLRDLRVHIAELNARIGRGKWKSSSSLARHEIPRVIWCLQKAFDHIIEEGNARTDESGIEEEISA